MKKKIQLILTSFVLIFVGITICACDGDNWYPEDNVLTDASHGSLTNHQIIATGEVHNVTTNSATILLSANYNYKNSLDIKPGILIGTNYDGSDWGFDYYDHSKEHIEINSFTNSACEVTLSNLQPSTTYYYRAYAWADRCDHYGEIKSFRTSYDTSIIDAVDLGLSVKWANMNIGASTPEDYGNKFYWGGIEASEKNFHADWHDFSLSTLQNQGYINKDNNLCSPYDAATQIWGSKWRMPTEDEFQELIDKCSWKKTTKNGKEVMLVTGPNSNVIYFPSSAGYWSSTANYSYSYYLWLNYINYRLIKEINTMNRDCLYAIRPVLK